MNKNITKAVEELAEQLHEWYLEATDEEGVTYNHEAVVPYADLPESSKIIDRYIAEKLLTKTLQEIDKKAREEERIKIRLIVPHVITPHYNYKCDCCMTVWDSLKEDKEDKLKEVVDDWNDQADRIINGEDKEVK